MQPCLSERLGESLDFHPPAPIRRVPRMAGKGHLRPVASMEKWPSRPDRVGLGWR
jgi:hypothetical protein